MSEKPEIELIADSRNGNRDALSELFRRHYTSSVRVARNILPYQDEFLDAVQAAYLSAFRHFDSFRAEASFKTWITRIVMNQCLMRLRDRTRHIRPVSLDDPGPGGSSMPVVDRTPTPEDVVRTEELGEALTEMAARLPKSLRDAFTLCIVSGLSLQDTAEALGLSLAATKTRLFRARLLLRSQLKEVWTNERTRRNGSFPLNLKWRRSNHKRSIPAANRHNIFNAPEGGGKG